MLLAIGAESAEGQLVGRFKEVQVQFALTCSVGAPEQTVTKVGREPQGTLSVDFPCQGTTSRLDLSYSFPATATGFDGTPASFDPPLSIASSVTATWVIPPPPFPGPPYRLTAAAGISPGAIPCVDFQERTGLGAGTHTLTATKVCSVALARGLNGGFSALTASAPNYGGVHYDGQYYYDFAPALKPLTVSPSVAPNVIKEGFFSEPLPVTIRGERFQQGATVSVEDIFVQNVQFVDSGTIKAELAGFTNRPEGARDVEVRNPDGTKVTGVEAFFVSSLVLEPLEINQALPAVSEEGTTGTPHVAEHHTVVRARIRCRGADCESGKERTLARLHVLDSAGNAIAGSPFSPGYPPAATAEPVRVRREGTEYSFGERATGAEALDFAIRSDAFGEGTYTFAVEVDPRNPGVLPAAATSLNVDANLVRRLADQVFRKSGRPMRVAVLIGGTDTARIARASAALDFLAFVYPLSAGQRSMTVVPTTLDYTEDEATLADLTKWFTEQKAAGGNFTHAVLLTTRLQTPLDNGLSSCGVVGTFSSSYQCREPVILVRLDAERIDDFPRTVAHEIGHNLDLGDTYNLDIVSSPNSPSAECVASQGCRVEEGALHGVTGNIAIRHPANADYGLRDFMGARQETVQSWVDRRTWNYLRGILGPASSIGVMSEVREWLAVSGTTATNGTAAISSATSFTADASTTLISGNDYELRLLDAGGAVLATHPFGQLTSFAHRVTVPAQQVFSLTVPFVSGARRLVIARGGAEAASRQISPLAPTVRLTSPNGGETLSGTTTVQWTAADADANPLTFSLFFAPTGSAPVPIATGLTGTSYSWDTTLWPGTSSGKLLITANDGVNQTTDGSDGTFSIARRNPSAAIVIPAHDSILPASQPVRIEASAWDPEDGTLTGSALELRSDRDGVLGTGSPIVRTLSTGTHVLTLSAKDSDGNAATQSVTVQVSASAQALSVRASTPSATSGKPPLTVQFSAEISGGAPPYAILWNFGDGDTSTESSPVHTYTQGGTYEAIVSVTDRQRITSSGTVPVSVLGGRRRAVGRR